MSQDHIKGVTKLGTPTDYVFHKPHFDMLETFPNPTERDYIITHETDEFTSLCPKTKAPDFGVIYIEYVPDEVCVESKSLKLYLFAYRNEGSFMEATINKIYSDLKEVLSPKRLKVAGTFKPRGGIETVVIIDSSEDIIS